MGFSFTTFLFEIVNFLVLMWLLRRIVYKPLRAGIEARRSELTARERAAEEEMEAAERLERELSSRSAELEELRARTLREAMEQAAEERARLLEQAREDAAAERSRAQRLLEVEREAAEAWVREVAVEHSAEVAGRLLMQLAPEAVEASLFERLLGEVERRAESLRRAVEQDGAGEVEVSCARPLPDADGARLRERLESVLGRAPRLVVRDDDSLVAGLVLRAGHLVLDASIAGQLDAFRDRVRSLTQAEASVA